MTHFAPFCPTHFAHFAPTHFAAAFCRHFAPPFCPILPFCPASGSSSPRKPVRRAAILAKQATYAAAPELTTEIFTR